MLLTGRDVHFFYYYHFSSWPGTGSRYRAAECRITLSLGRVTSLLGPIRAADAIFTLRQLANGRVAWLSPHDSSQVRLLQKLSSLFTAAI